jgi:NAD(P)-dependent dehydrogenase (short-subunit alcohol dehydrogenase family)
MGRLSGRVAVITGAGGGLGREHALLFAEEGAKVVVNDLGSAPDGSGVDSSPAGKVAEEIRALGGEAVANHDSVASWDGAQRLVATAIEAFGDLHVLVNNAGILRDRVIVNMTEQDWDDVVEVHLKGHFCPLRFAANYWREQAKTGREIAASVVNTASGSGLFGSAGQANYSAAKAGVASLTIVAARELARYGVRTNAIAPLARTRLTEATPGLSERIKAPADGSVFDPFDPANVSPLVAYLATAECPFNGQVFGISGGQVMYDVGWTVAERFVKEGRWTVAELEASLKDLPTEPPAFPMAG